MKTFLHFVIIFMLFKKIHSQKCQTNTGKLVCESITLEKGKPLEVNNYKQVLSIDFNYCTIPVVPIGVFVYFESATVLWLDNSEVRTIVPGAFNGLTNLLNLHLENNNIMKLEAGVFDGLTKLKDINLDDNHIFNLNRYCFTNLTHLSTLRINHNNIKSIPEKTFENLPNLQSLLVHHNAITNLEKNCFVDLPSLTYLNLGHNLLANINCEIFDGLDNLSILDLDHNNLTAIPTNCFQKTKNLKELNLNDNKLVEVDAQNVFSCLSKFSTISLNNNSWNCNSLLNAVKVLKNYNVNISDDRVKTATNVYGVACKWDYGEFNKKIKSVEKCQQTSELNNYTTAGDIIISESTPTFEMQDGEILDFTTEQSQNLPVSENLEENCTAFPANSIITIILIILVVSLSIIVLILLILLCRSYRRENSFKIKNIALATL